MFFGSKVQTINIFKFLKQKSSENHGIVNAVKTAKPVVKGYYNQQSCWQTVLLFRSEIKGTKKNYCSEMALERGKIQKQTVEFYELLELFHPKPFVNQPIQKEMFTYNL